MTTICFTGRRPKDLWGYADRQPYIQMTQNITRLLREIYDSRGIERVITGGAQGIDTCAFWATWHLNRELAAEGRPLVRNVVHVPFAAQPSRWREDGMFGQAEYRHMLEEADEVVVISEDPTDGRDAARKLTLRNTAMVRESCAVIAVTQWTGGPYEAGEAPTRLELERRSRTRGGTSDAMRRALSANKPLFWHDPMTGQTSLYK